MKTKHLLICISFFLSLQLVNAQNPKVWGTTQSGGTFSGGTIFSMNANGSDFNTEYNFGWPGGWLPMGNMIEASDGNLYGTCYEGGDYASCTIYEYDEMTGDYEDVYSFDITHGDYPTSGMVERNGNLYGNTPYGGALGSGVIYRYEISSMNYTDIYDLPSNSNPYSAPIIATDGNLYGTNACVWFGNGTIYKYDLTNNTYTNVHSFDQTEGANPYGGLMQATDGKFYGMTLNGGANSHGVIYSFDPSDNTYESLYDFDGTNGGDPKGTLIQGSDGKLYGLTTGGGANNIGAIFSFDLSNNTYFKLYDFATADGSTPLGSLMQTGSILLGTTSAGGINGDGTAFNYNFETNSFNKLLDFNGTNGSAPSGGFITTGDDVANGIATPVTTEINVYPNPVSQYVFCSLPSGLNGTVSFIVTDLCGKEIFNQQVTASSSKVKIDLSSLSSGVYNVQVIAGNEKKVVKLMKQ